MSRKSIAMVIISWLILLGALFGPMIWARACGTAGKSYYFSNSGSDNNNCLSPSQACQTITKLNSLSYNAGDVIMLHAGDTFTDHSIDLIGPNIPCCYYTQNVSAGPITLQSYGSGTCNAIAGTLGGCGTLSVTNLHTQTGQIDDDEITVYNINNMIVQNLNIVGNSHCNENQWGIAIGSLDHNGGHYQNMTVQNVNVTGCSVGIGGQGGGNGQTVTNLSFLNNHAYGTVGNEDFGIYIVGNPDVNIAAQSILNINIAGNLIENIAGIANQFPAVGTGSGALIKDTDGGIVQNNLVRNTGRNSNTCGGPAGLWTFHAKNIVFQYNEVYGLFPTAWTAGCDWDGFDIDGDSTNITMQYNYSHDNWGAGYALYNLTQGVAAWTGNIVRYNVAQNNANLGDQNFFGNCLAMTGSNSYVGSGFKFYNNSCYLSGSNAIYNITVRRPTGPDVVIANNILSSTGQSGALDDGGFPGFIADGNDYLPGNVRAMIWNGTSYADIPSWNAAFPGADPHQKNVDPSWSGPPPAGNCNVLGGPPQPCPSAYNLNPGSPMIGTGTDLIKAYGIGLPAKDYYGNTIPNGTGTGYNVGADGAHH